MRKEKLVSIIVPVYNVAPYLDEAVSSAVSQTYGNIEIILVDDGAADGSGEKCDLWAEKSPKVKVIHKTNGGLSSARNAGLDAAAGDYILFLDGDDWIAPDLVRTTVLYMDLGYDMVIFQHYAVYEDGRQELRTCRLGEYEIEGEKERADYYVKTLLSYNIGWEAWNRMFRMDIIKRLGLRYEDNRRIFAEDLYFMMCYSLAVKRILSISNAFYYYRLRGDSIMGREKRNLNIGRINELSKAAFRFFKRHRAAKELMDLFPYMHYVILRDCAEKYKKAAGIRETRLRREIMEDITDRRYFRYMLRKLLREKKNWQNYVGREEGLYLVKITNYWLTGNLLLFTLGTEKIRAYRRSVRRKDRKYLELAPHKEKKLFFIGSETFGNLGDGMIAETMNAFCRHCLPEIEVEEYPLSIYWNQKRYLLSAIQPDDIIVMSGGGNFGNKYPEAQEVKRDIVRTWKQNKKIIFPQTVYYLDGTDESLREDESLFCAENHVVLFTRDRRSFDFAREHFTCEIKLAPDIVLARNMQKPVKREDRIVLLLRGDSEKAVSADELEAVAGLVCGTGMEVCYTDLQVIYHGADILVRKKEISKKLDLVRSSRLVVTDRLHGMIIAAVTGTPCLVFPNFNFKVKGTYEWLSYLPYLRFAENIGQAERYLGELLTVQQQDYDNKPLLPYFIELAKVLKSDEKVRGSDAGEIGAI